MSDSLTVRCLLPRAGRHGRRPAPALTEDRGRVPRVARLLALAHRLDGLLRDGVVRDAATLARLGHVSRARLSQILSLLLLAPDLQEAILFLPPVTHGRARLSLADLLPIAAECHWARQRRRWRALQRRLRAESE